jgi:molybdate transport system ATP-binding protein
VDGPAVTGRDTGLDAGLDADLAASVGRFRLEVSVQVHAGETVAIVGPNGAGKSTVLRALAGLLPIEAGHVALDGVVLDGGPGGPFVPPHERPIGVVFQDYVLFPHLRALDNVAFGLRSRGVPRRRAAAQARTWLERVGLAEHADRRPSELSGGQAQRIALARALVIEPALLLLDEPLAALDATTRATTRRELRRQLDGYDGVRLLVTHDPLDAAALADRIVVVDGGRVVQEGTLDELAARPRSRYVADLVGINLLSGRATDGRVDVGGLVLTVADRVSGDVLVAIPPTAVALSLTHPEGVARNVWPATIDGIERLAGRARIQLRGPVAIVAEVTEAAATELAAAGGREIWVSVKATEIEVFPA